MSEEARSRTVGVLGFGRSGTSLTMRILRELGVELGPEEDMLAPQEADNPRGYWEPRWMVDLNDEILAALGTTWWRPFPGDAGWEDAPQVAPLLERARALYEEKLGGAPLAGWKDPRTTLTLPLWQKIVPDPCYVICLRNPIDAIASIQRRPEPTLPTQAWGELWLEYTARALSGTAGARRLIVFYEDLLRNPQTQVVQLASLLDLAPDDECIAQAAALIDGELHHHRSSSIDVAVASGISAPARTLYLALRAAHELRRLPDEDADADADAEARRTSDAIERVALDGWRGSQEVTLGRERASELEASLAREHELRGRMEKLLAREQQHFASEQKLRDELVHAMEQHERDMTALQSSVSWRITTPLRAMKRVVRRSSR